jgi:hypothetical protein
MIWKKDSLGCSLSMQQIVLNRLVPPIVIVGYSCGRTRKPALCMTRFELVQAFQIPYTQTCLPWQE